MLRWRDRQGQSSFEVEDDGVGVAAGQRDRGGTLGLELVRTLASQLHASFALAGDTGVRATVTFNDPQGGTSP